eukprot:scaffold2590_cov160-Amphora_coffeaeformis.AAC.6
MNGEVERAPRTSVFCCCILLVVDMVKGCPHRKYPSPSPSSVPPPHSFSSRDCILSQETQTRLREVGCLAFRHICASA